MYCSVLGRLCDFMCISFFIFVGCCVSSFCFGVFIRDGVSKHRSKIMTSTFLLSLRISLFGNYCHNQKGQKMENAWYASGISLREIQSSNLEDDYLSFFPSCGCFSKEINTIFYFQKKVGTAEGWSYSCEPAMGPWGPRRFEGCHSARMFLKDRLLYVN